MTNEQQFQLTVGLFSGILTCLGVLIGIIFNSFKRTQEKHAEQLSDNSKKISEQEKEIVQLKERQYLKIEKLEESFEELKTEVHELRKELKQQIEKENDVLRDMLRTMNNIEQQLKQDA